MLSKSSDRRLIVTPGMTMLSIIEELPAEVLLSITDFVCTVDAACFSLSSRSVLYKVGTSSWSKLRTSTSRRQTFLSRLAKDSKEYICCFPCGKLHLASEIGSADQRDDPWNKLRCTEFPGLGESQYHLFRTNDSRCGYQLTFQHVQAYMLHHRNGAGPGTPLDTLWFREVLHRSDNNTTSLLTVEPAIMQDQLHLRIQQWLLVPRAAAAVKRRPNHDLDICRHISGVLLFNHPRLINKRFSKGKKSLPADGERRERRFQCNICNVEFHAFTKDLGEHGKATVVTKWVNLGSGHTPEDDLWRSKLKPIGTVGLPIHEKHDSEETLYHTKEFYDPLQILTKENEHILCDEIYKETSRYSDHWSDTCQEWTQSMYSTPGYWVCPS